MAPMPERKTTTILSWPIARELAVLAKCDPRTIQEAARGHHGKGEPAVRARRVVADYFDLNPGIQPSTWKRPAEQPLKFHAVREIGARVGVDVEDVQRAARGLPVYGDKAVELLAAVKEYFEAHPDERPAPPSNRAPAAESGVTP